MWEKAVAACSWSLKYVPDHLKNKKCAMKLLKKRRAGWNMFLTALRQDWCVPEDKKKNLFLTI